MIMQTKDIFQYLVLFSLLILIEAEFQRNWANGQSCKDFIEDCVCTDYDKTDRKELKCGRSYTINEYTSRLKKAQFPNNTNLDITFFDLRKTPNVIDSKSFVGLHIKSLKFSKCNITKWADTVPGPAFVGLEDSLEYLNIYKSIIRPSKSAPWYTDDEAAFTIRHLNKLKEVVFQYNNLYNFCNGWFKDGLGDSLERLTLHNNDIWYICDDAFSHLKKLKFIDMSDNKFFKISRNMFPNPAIYLKKIHLGFNKIKVLPEDIFKNMPALYEVNLNRNDDLFKLAESIWRPVWSQLRFLYFEVSRLSCAEHSIQWMFQLKRPEYLYATCSWPKEMKGKVLRHVIDEKKKEAQ